MHKELALNLNFWYGLLATPAQISYHLINSQLKTQTMLATDRAK